jgi:hypothetical protein
MEPVGKYYQVYSSRGQITQEINELKKKRDKSSLLSKGSSDKNSHDSPPSSQEDEAIVVDDLDGIGNGGCWTIYIIMNVITNKNHYHNYRSEKIIIISDVMTKIPKTVTWGPYLLLTNTNPNTIYVTDDPSQKSQKFSLFQ